jgi:hypothetical protein
MSITTIFMVHNRLVELEANSLRSFQKALQQPNSEPANNQSNQINHNQAIQTKPKTNSQ